KLDPGRYGYKLVVDGNWTLDPGSYYRKYVGGIENSELRVDDCNVPLLQLASWKVDQAAHTLDAEVTVLDGAAGHGIDEKSLVTLLDGQPIGKPYAGGHLTLHAGKLGKGKHV